MENNTYFFAQNIIHIRVQYNIHIIHIAFTEYHEQVTTDIGVLPTRKGGGARLGTKWFFYYFYAIVLMILLVSMY